MYQLPEGLHPRFHHERCTEGDIISARIQRRAAPHKKPIVATWTREFIKQSREHDPRLQIDPRGGKTICLIENDDYVVVARGEAYCSDLDNFCYRIGRDIAFGRALKALHHARNIG